MNIEKNKNFTDRISNRLNYVPGPRYVQHSDWRENIRGRTGKFLGRPRTTFTDEIMKFEKTKPAPSTFDNKEKLKKMQKIPGSYTYKDTRVHFTEHKKWLAMQVPPARYANTNVKLTKPRTLGMSFGKPSTPKGSSSWVIPKMADPGPGSYNVSEAITTSQWAKIKGTTKKSAFPVCFTDRQKAMSAGVPGPGHNKTCEAAKDKVAKDVNFTYKRH